MPKPLTVSPKTRAAIGHLIEGRAKTQSAAARLAGMSREQFCKALKKPHVERYLHEQCTAHLRGIPAAIAAAALTTLLHAKSEDVRARVATRVAEGAGVLVSREQSQTGAGSGSGPVLTVVFKHMTPGGTTQIAAQIGAESVHIATHDTQRIEDARPLEREHYPDKVANLAEGGPGELITTSSSEGPGGQKTRDAERRPPPHTREPSKGPAGIILNFEKGPT